MPEGVERLYGDRSNLQELERALAGRTFDAVVDTTLYNGPDALTTIRALNGKTGHYIFIGTGQVYLVRTGLQRPFHEEDYEGEVMEAPPEAQESDLRNWLYGFHKRAAEDHLFHAWKESQFPVTSLRAPMINGEKDHYGRILGYVRRLEDGGPVLIPEEGSLQMRHVYCSDVAKIVADLIESGRGKGRAYNVAQDETISLNSFLESLAQILNVKLQLKRIPRAKLEELKLLPACSPFSDPWMSELDNSRSKQELGVRYTSWETCLKNVALHYKNHPQLQPEGYQGRSRELMPL